MDVDVDIVETELNAYTKVQEVHLDTDPLMWWKYHVQEFPRLVRMTSHHLSVPATSVSPERLCNRVGIVKSDLWGSLLVSTLIDVMWAKHCVIDTLVIVTDTHKHINRVLCTYMTSYLPQAYRLSILIDKQSLFINSWLIRLSVDNVLLINTVITLDLIFFL
jgi:hypothetical protein